MLVVNTNTSSINAFNSIRTNQSDVARGSRDSLVVSESTERVMTPRVSPSALG